MSRRKLLARLVLRDADTGLSVGSAERVVFVDDGLMSGPADPLVDHGQNLYARAIGEIGTAAYRNAFGRDRSSA